MKLGIIGKPQSGKTTVFNAACGKQEAVGDYSQAVHRSIIKVPDKRVDELAKIFNPKKVTYAEIDMLDAPGFSGKGKESGGLEISQDLKMMEALMCVIDCFSPDANPERDIKDLVDEMIIHDQTIIESNIAKKEKNLLKTGEKTIAVEIELFKRALSVLEQEQPLLEMDMDENEYKALKNYMFMSLKPMVVVLNISEDKLGEINKIESDFQKLIKPNKREAAVMCGSVEMELVGLDENERRAFLDEMGIATSAVEQVIQKSYTLLGLQSFFTTGETDVRAWTIKKGTNAQKAAGVIHSDIERGFIRAEVSKYDDMIEHKTVVALKSAGKQRLEGKEYVVQEGDIMLFRFNV